MSNDKQHIITKRIKELGLNQIGLSRQLGLPDNTIAKIVNNQRSIKVNEIVKLAKFLKYDVESFIKYISGESNQEPISMNNTESDTLLLRYMNVEPSAGNGIFADTEYIKSFMKLSKGQLTSSINNSESCVILAISGNSMEPTLHDRDFVIIDTKDCRIIDGKIYVIRVKDEDTLYIKRLFRNPVTKEITIRSDNNQYQEWKTDEKDIKICGRLICKVFEEI